MTSLAAQCGGGQIDRLGGELGPRYADPALNKLPVPHLPDGTVDLSGVWRDGGEDHRGTPHTEQMHLVERWTRTNYTTLRRVITIDDPGTFTKPFEYTATARLTAPDSEIIEYFCQENNQYGLPSGLTAK